MKRAEQWITIDNYKRKYFLKTELKKKLFKSLIKNSKLSVSYRYLANIQKSKLNKLYSLSTHNNRCVYTGRTWGINRMSQMSRFYFRNETYKGNLPGFKRASW